MSKNQKQKSTCQVSQQESVDEAMHLVKKWKKRIIKRKKR